MTRIRTTKITKTKKMWMNPPIVEDVTSPRSHKPSKITKIVQSIWALFLKQLKSMRLGLTDKFFGWKVLQLIGACIPRTHPTGTSRSSIYFCLNNILGMINGGVCSLVHSPIFCSENSLRLKALRMLW